MKIYDITPTVSPNTAVFPGDTPFSLNVNRDYEKGDSYALNSITTTTHIGAHTDAPYHYHEQGDTIEKRNLNIYLGPCQVITVTDKKFITPDDLNEIKAERILFKTNSYPDAQNWQDDFAALTPELIKVLAERKVVLVGIDTPSVDQADSKELETHHAIYENDMAILEGITLKDVPDGFYTLVALPLKLEGADASPVRAVLIV